MPVVFAGLASNAIRMPGAGGSNTEWVLPKNRLLETILTGGIREAHKNRKIWKYIIFNSRTRLQNYQKLTL